MRFATVTLLAAAALAGCATTPSAAVMPAQADKAALKAANEGIRKTLRKTTVSAVKPTPIPGLFEVIAGHNVFYADKRARYLVFGHIYRLRDQKDLTQAAIDKLRGHVAARRAGGRHIAWSSLPLKHAIRTGDPHGVKIAVFADPKCPYCRKLHAVMRYLKHADVYTVMYPLTQLHPGSGSVSREVLCSNEPRAALQAAYTDRPIPAVRKDCHTTAVSVAEAFGKAHGFYGTPVLVRQDGQVLIGYRPLATLQKWVDALRTTHISRK